MWRLSCRCVFGTVTVSRSTHSPRRPVEDAGGPWRRAAELKGGTPAARAEQRCRTGLRGQAAVVVCPETGARRPSARRSACGVGRRRRTLPEKRSGPAVCDRGPRSMAASEAGQAPADRHHWAETRVAGLGGDRRRPSHRARSRRRCDARRRHIARAMDSGLPRTQAKEDRIDPAKSGQIESRLSNRYHRNQSPGVWLADLRLLTSSRDA